MSSTALAEDARPKTDVYSLWQGIWSGTIGGQAVMACLDVPDNEASPSAYYYLNHGAIIALAAENEPGTLWMEGSDKHRTGKWKLDTLNGETLLGNWTDPRGQRSVPIALTRVHAVPDPDSASTWEGHALCRSIAFYRPRADAEQLIIGKTQSMQNRRFRDYSARSSFSKERFKAGQGQLNSAVELLEPGPRVKALNKFFRERWRNRLARGYVNEQGGLAEFFESVEFYSERWLTLDEMELPAGFAWSSARRWRETWNLQSGKQVDLWTWFNKSGGSWEPSNSEPGKLEFHASKALQQLAQRLIQRDPDCKEQEVSIGDVRLAQNGIAFSSGFGPCLQEAVLPFKDLLPFLNQQGLAEVKLVIDTKAP